MMLAQTSSSSEATAEATTEATAEIENERNFDPRLSYFMKAPVPDEPKVCLDVRSMNYRAEVLHPVIGPKIAIQRATFTVEDVDLCTGADSNLALYVVFSSPHKKNQTYIYTQDLLRQMKADTFEVAVESTCWLDPGTYGLQIQIRDMNSQIIERETQVKSI